MDLVREAPLVLGAPPAAAVDDQLRELEHLEQVGLRTPLSVLRDITAYSPAAAVRLIRVRARVRVSRNPNPTPEPTPEPNPNS